MRQSYFIWIQNNFDLQKINEEVFHYKKNGNKISIDLKENKWRFEGVKNQHNRIWDLSNEENNIVLILCLKLLKIGYSKKHIILEKKLGGMFLDICLEKNEVPYYMIEVKTPREEIAKYTSSNTKEKQLFKYLFQEKTAKVASYYTFNLDNESDSFFNVTNSEELRNSNNFDDLFSNKWNKLFDRTNLLSLPVFDFKIREKKFIDLKEIKGKGDSDGIFNDFLRILRVHSVSDKSNAFDKIINLFIAKVCDEECEDQNFSIETEELNKKFHCLRFQFLEGIDTLETFMKRLSDLYKEGMEKYLEKEVIDYSEDKVREILNSLGKNLTLTNKKKITKIIDDLRLKKSNFFAFIEVFDDDTFERNSRIVKEVVKKLSEYKFRYNNKSEFLGYLFEKLLNESLKQEAGQFFTPLSLVNFMINSLPLKEKLEENIKENKKEIIPLFVDYACGSGHFLNSYMQQLQKKINDLNQTEYPSRIKSKLNTYKDGNFSWVENNVFGIEKDYRLAKTTKISLFLHGDGLANILHADALNKFSCDDYAKFSSKLFSKDNKIEIFDFVVSNPPYAVKGYMQNFSDNGISIEDKNDKTFELIKKFSDKAKEIEIAFVERAWQLLKKGGFAFIILPNSFLSKEKYSTTRKWILERFQILTIFCSGDSTFASTSTSTTIIFMRKKSSSPKLETDYQCLLINSPKAFANSRKVKIDEERTFLGYKFSNARGKLGCETLNNNLVDSYSSLVKKMCWDASLAEKISEEEKEEWIKKKEEEKKAEINDKHSRLVNLQEIILDAGEKNRYCLYTRYKKPVQGEKYFSLKDVCKINFHKKSFYDKEKLNSLDYIKIRDIHNNKIEKKSELKKGNSWRIAKEGDILFPQNASLKWAQKIVKIDKDYKVTTAIFTLTFTDEKVRKHVFDYLKDDRNNVFEDIKNLIDGFKITYSKITEFNLMNNIFFEKDG